MGSPDCPNRTLDGDAHPTRRERALKAFDRRHHPGNHRSATNERPMKPGGRARGLGVAKTAPTGPVKAMEGLKTIDQKCLSLVGCLLLLLSSCAWGSNTPKTSKPYSSTHACESKCRTTQRRAPSRRLVLHLAGIHNITSRVRSKTLTSTAGRLLTRPRDRPTHGTAASRRR